MKQEESKTDDLVEELSNTLNHAVDLLNEILVRRDQNQLPEKEKKQSKEKDKKKQRKKGSKERKKEKQNKKPKKDKK